jgi:hypothetical protein
MRGGKAEVEDTDVVTIPVPKRHLARIYAFIGSLDAPEVHAAVAGANGAGETVDEWSLGMVERQYRESPDSMKRFQQWLADHPGQEFTSTQMGEALDVEYGWNSIAGMLGAYGNRVRNRYGKASFPFQSRTDYEAGEVLHSMTPEVAEIIKALA